MPFRILQDLTCLTPSPLHLHLPTTLPLTHSLDSSSIGLSASLPNQMPSHLIDFVLGVPTSKYSAGLREAPASLYPHGLLDLEVLIAILTICNHLIAFGLFCLFTVCLPRPEYNLHRGEVCLSSSHGATST